ncbi:MAG: metallophosphoesterase [Planctomycetes bacterium]|nr:metallophosphoesterase [Planctomycetota bacterium]
MSKKQCLVFLAVISVFFMLGSFVFAEVPDELRVEGPIPHQVPAGTTENIRATVLQGFVGVAGAEVVFTKQSGSFSFNAGVISPDETQSVVITDSSGVAMMNIYAGCADPCADCTGPCLIEVTVTGTKLSAFSIFDIIESISSTMVKGPYLIYNGTNTEMDVLWQFDRIPCGGSTIEWGLDTNYDLGSVATTEYGNDHQHKYTITSLTPGSRYYYQVKESDSVVHTGDFLAAPSASAGQVKFLAYGDTRTNPADHDNVCAAMVDAYMADPDYQSLLLHVGDWTEDGTETQWNTEYFGLANAQTLMSQVPINGCKGNHENRDAGDNYAKYWPYPYVADHYWSFDYGPVHVSVIDQYVPYEPGSAQYTWLENDLASSNAEWKFLLMHEPAWSGDSRSNEIAMQNTFQPLCLAYGVDIVLAGHNHHYARANVDGVQHITTGGGGAPLDEITLSYPELVSSAETFQFCEIDIQDYTLNFISRDIDGSVIDSFSLYHSICDDEICDLADLARFGSHWLDTDCIAPAWCDKTDLDKSGDVTIGDIVLLAENWLIDFSLKPIGYWKFDGDALDSSGNANDATAVGVPTYNPTGHIDGSVVFNGSTDYFQLQGFPCVTGGKSRTVEGWIKTTVGGEIMGWGSPFTGAKWHMNILDGPGVAGALQVNVWDGHVVGSTDLRDGAWHHVAAIVRNDGSPNADEIELYVDGKEEDYSDVLSIPINTGAEDLSRIGVYVAGSGGLYYFFDGEMDDMRLYEGALSANQMADKGGWDGLLGHWPLDTDATDSSGDGHDGTEAGGLIYTGTGKVGGAAVFDGSDDYIEMIGYNGAVGNRSRTIAAWIKTSASDPMEIAYWGQAGNGVRWKFQLVDGVGAAGAVQLDVSGGYVVGSTNVRDGVWHHVAAVLEDDGTPNANEVKLYVDGELETISASLSHPVLTGGDVNMMIGGILGTSVVYNFDGEIDDVRLYGIALSQGQIQELVALGD